MNIQYSALNRVYINQEHITGYDMIYSDDRYQNIYIETTDKINVKGMPTNFCIDNNYLRGDGFKESVIMPNYKELTCVSSEKNSGSLYNILFNLFDKGALLINPEVALQNVNNIIDDCIIPIYNIVFDDYKLDIYYRIKETIFPIVSHTDHKMHRVSFYVVIPKEIVFSKGNFIKYININNVEYALYLINNYGILDDISYFDLNALCTYARNKRDEQLLNYAIIKDNGKFPLYQIFKPEIEKELYCNYSCNETILLEDHMFNLKSVFFNSLFLYRNRISKYYTEN